MRGYAANTSTRGEQGIDDACGMSRMELLKVRLDPGDIRELNPANGSPSTRREPEPLSGFLVGCAAACGGLFDSTASEIGDVEEVVEVIP